MCSSVPSRESWCQPRLRVLEASTPRADSNTTSLLNPGSPRLQEPMTFGFTHRLVHMSAMSRLGENVARRKQRRHFRSEGRG